MDKNLGIEVINQAIIEIENSIKKFNGHLNIKMKPKAVSDVDDMELDALMKRAELENAEVSGDEDDSDSANDD